MLNLPDNVDGTYFFSLSFVVSRILPAFKRLRYENRSGLALGVLECVRIRPPVEKASGVYCMASLK